MILAMGLYMVNLSVWGLGREPPELHLKTLESRKLTSNDDLAYS